MPQKEKVFGGNHSLFLQKEMSKTVMTRAGPHDNNFRQLKKVKKVHNSNLKNTNLKSFLSDKRLGYNKITLAEKENL